MQYLLALELAEERNKVDEPLFSAPQHSHFRIESLIPLEGSSRLPQSVQKTRDPIADILAEFETGEDFKR